MPSEQTNQPGDEQEPSEEWWGVAIPDSISGSQQINMGPVYTQIVDSDGDQIVFNDFVRSEARESLRGRRGGRFFGVTDRMLNVAAELRALEQRHAVP